MTHASETPHKGHKKALSIRLSESAVYLRTEGHGRRTTRDVDSNSRGSLLRGLLVLELAKSTKISSIELELIATACNTWSGEATARGEETTEQHRVFHASTVFFQASKPGSSSRRAVSLGPGVTTAYDPDQDWEAQGGDASGPPNLTSDYPNGLEVNVPITSTSPAPIAGPSSSQTASTRPQQTLRERRASVGSHFFLSDLAPYHETQSEVPIPPYSPTDPNGLSFAASPLSPTFPDTPWLNLVPSPDETRGHHPSQDLEEFRNSLNTNLQSFHHHELSPSPRSATERSPLSRQTTRMDNVPEDDTLEPNQPVSPRSSTHLRPDPSLSPRPSAHSPTGSLSGSGESSAPPATRPDTRESPARPSMLRRFSGDNRTPPQSKPSTTSRGREDARNRSRFSLSSLSDALKEVVRSTSTSRAARLILPSSGRSSRRTSPDARDPRTVAATPRTSMDVAREPERSSSRVRRGRTMDRRALVFGGMDAGNGTMLSSRPSSLSPDPRDRTRTPQSTSTVNASRSRQREARIWGVAFDYDNGGITKGKHEVHGWKEFKKGTYNYPISFTIPTTAPPSMQSTYGSVVWRLNATVHRPGAFTQKMTVSREVLVVSCPSEEDTEDTENVIVERQWEDQLHYLISISGRSFYIGGTVPVMFALVPLGKLKIYRLLVYIEERIDYYTNMHRIAQSNPVTRFDLLSVKHEGGRNARHILPLDSDDTDILKSSPLAPLFNTDDDTSELASSLMGPGPWTFHQNLKLPSSCDAIHFTNKNRRANIVVNHVLKVVLRVERGDDMYLDKAGKRKLFDIVVQTPIQILSCRCNPEWVSLPPYSETFNDSAPLVPSCPCQIKHMQERHAHSGIDHILDRVHLPHIHIPLSPPSPVAGPSRDRLHDHPSEAGNGTSLIDPNVVRSLLHHNEVSTFATSQRYERLVAGQETEFGEPPPAYSPACMSNGS